MFVVDGFPGKTLFFVYVCTYCITRENVNIRVALRKVHIFIIVAIAKVTVDFKISNHKTFNREHIYVPTYS